MTTVISRRERKKDETRVRLIAAALDLLSAHGIDAVTVDQIAEAADVGKGTVYNYFRAKEDMVVAFMVDLERRVQARIARMPASKRSLEAILADVIRYQFRLKRRYHAFVRVFLTQMVARMAEFGPYMAEMQKAIDPTLETLFRTLQQRGLIRADASIAELCVVFKTVHMGLTMLWAIEGPPFRSMERVLRSEIHFFCKGLEPR